MAKLARGAWPWLLVPLAVAAMLLVAAAAFWWLAIPGLLALLVFLFFLNFFRDPERAVGQGIVSPAHGKVVAIDVVEDADVGRADRLAVFMSPLDVHVNRFPLDGEVLAVRHVPGGYLPAFNKDSDRNERVETVLRTELGTVKMVQIAGAVARRIVPYIGPGHAASKGERMGLIRLGSRCDLLLPVGACQWTAKLGDKVQAGATTLAVPIPKPVTASAKDTPTSPPAGRARAGAKAGTQARPKAAARTTPTAARAAPKTAARPAPKARAPRRRQG